MSAGLYQTLLIITWPVLTPLILPSTISAAAKAVLPSAVFAFSVLPTLISIYAMSRKDVIDT